MAKSVLDILIKLSKQGNADKETITGLVKLKSSFMDAAAVAGSLVAAGYAVKKVFDATVGTMVEYADKVRTTSRATQLSSEESSKLIQMTDDLGVSYEGLEKAIKSSSDTTDFSIAGLMKTSEEYLNITGAQERAKFAQEQYGKAWIEMVGVLEKGPAAIQAASDAISSNLILTDEAVRQAREYEIALDNVNDSWTGLTVTAGAEALPMLNTLLLAVQKNIDAGLSWRDVVGPVALFDTIKSLAQAHKELNPEIDSGVQSYTAWAEALENATTSTDGLSGAMDEIAVNYSEIIGLTDKISDSQTSYSEKLDEVNANIMLSEDERIAKLRELKAEYDMATNKIVADNFLQQLSIGGLEKAEFDKAIAFQEATGLITPQAAAQATALNSITTAAANGTITVQQMRDQIAQLQSKTVTLTVNQVLNNISGGAVFDHIGNGGRAAGGPVNANQVYVVGEEGPELFVSNQSGTIIPNGGFNSGGGGGGGGRNGNVTINLSIQSAVSVQEGNYAQNVLYPFIESAVSRLRSEGKL